MYRVEFLCYRKSDGHVGYFVPAVNYPTHDDIAVWGNCVVAEGWRVLRVRAILRATAS